MFRHFYLLLLFCPVHHNGNTDTPVSGKKGGNITLTCEFKNDKIVQIDLFKQSKYIDVCQEKNCSGRVFKQRDCDVVIKNLTFSDAGTYTLRVHYINDETNVAQQKEWNYQLHIHDEISVKTESGTGSAGKLDTDEDKTDHTKEHTTETWIVPVVVCSVILAVAGIAVIIWRYRPRGYRRAAVQENPGH